MAANGSAEPPFLLRSSSVWGLSRFIAPVAMILRPLSLTVRAILLDWGKLMAAGRVMKRVGNLIVLAIAIIGVLTLFYVMATVVPAIRW